MSATDDHLDEVYSALGDAGQAYARLFGRCCRGYFTDIQPWRAEQYINMELTKVQQARVRANSLGWDTTGIEKIESGLQALDGADVLDIAESERDFSEFQCGYQQTGNETACFGCPMRRQMIKKAKNRAKKKTRESEWS